MLFNPNKAREIIMEHYKNPLFKSKVSEGTNTYYSNTCSDKLELELTWNNDVLINAKFDGHGCAIFIASTDILLKTLINKSKEKIINVINLYEKFLNDPSKYSNEELKPLESLWVFFNVKKHLSRLSCSLLTANAIKEEFEKTL